MKRCERQRRTMKRHEKDSGERGRGVRKIWRKRKNFEKERAEEEKL